MTTFKNIGDLKRMPVIRGPQVHRLGLRGFPVPMSQQMRQPQKLKFPKPIDPFKKEKPYG